MSQSGSAAVETVLLAPAVAMLVWLLIWAATVTQTPATLQVAVEDAARLASVTRSVAEREPAARALVESRVGDTCDPLTVSLVQDEYLLTVTAECGVVSPQAEVLGVPERTVTVVGRSAVDPFVEVRP